MIAYIIGMVAAALICILNYLVNHRPFEKEPLEQPKPFIVSEYYGRIEQAALDILEVQEPIDKIIILWWGLDVLLEGMQSRRNCAHRAFSLSSKRSFRIFL